jgi:hypothetical protein
VVVVVVGVGVGVAVGVVVGVAVGVAVGAVVVVVVGVGVGFVSLAKKTETKMSIEIKVYGTTADEALAELKTFSAGLLGGTALSSKVEIQPAAKSGDDSAAEFVAAQTEDRREGETEEQHGERKRKRRTKAEMEAARAAEANEAHAELAPVVGVDQGAGDTEVVELTPAAEEGRLTGAEDPFPPSDEPKTAPAAVDFATAYARYREANPDKDERAFLRAELQKLVDKSGMDAAREFMVANGYGAVSKIKPEERTAFLTAVYSKLAE